MNRKASSLVREATMLNAALALFTRVGFRAATMEQIAAEAGFSKATVYAYFSDKPDVFRAVADKVAAEMVAAIETNLERGDSPAQCVCAALQAKDVMIYELVRTSPHAAELFAAKNDLVGELFEETDQRIQKAIRSAIRGKTPHDVSAARLARILVRASRGLAAAAESSDHLRADIAILVDGMLGS